MTEVDSRAAPPLEAVFEARVEVGTPYELGEIGGGRRRVIPILGGKVRGPRLSAAVLPGGADWQTVHPDGRTELLARYTLRTADGSHIGVVNRGVRHGPADVMRRLVAGETVAAALYYFRGTPSFEAASGPHGWLMRHVFVCTGERLPDLVLLRFYVVG